MPRPVVKCLAANQTKTVRRETSNEPPVETSYSREQSQGREVGPSGSTGGGEVLEGISQEVTRDPSKGERELGKQGRKKTLRTKDREKLAC